MTDPNSSILTPSRVLLLCLQTEGSSTAHPANTGSSQTGSRIPHQDHPKSQGNNIRAQKHQLKMPCFERGSSWGSDTGKLLPVTFPHVYFVCICTLGRTEGAQDTVGMSQHTDLYLTAAAGTACGRKSWGATLPAPKSAHSWEEEMLSQLRDRIQDLIP